LRGRLHCPKRDDRQIGSEVIVEGLHQLRGREVLVKVAMRSWLIY
jgi:hypothetical protein